MAKLTTQCVSRLNAEVGAHLRSALALEARGLPQSARRKMAAALAAQQRLDRLVAAVGRVDAAATRG